MYNQEIFDKVAVALLKQGKQSINLNLKNDLSKCAYRSPEGLKCAIGHLIDDS